MMKICQENIFLTAGDGATFTVTPINPDGTQYAPGPGERLCLVVSEQGRRVLEQESATGDFLLTGADTAALRGRYTYRVELRYADGERETILGATPNKKTYFTVLEG